MDDRELLELAAKAAGYTDIKYVNEWWLEVRYGNKEAIWNGDDYWNPLTDDGDAFRLLVALSQADGGVALMLNSRWNQREFAQCYTSRDVVAPTEYMGNDPYAATRRAIVRTAAEIGRQA